MLLGISLSSVGNLSWKFFQLNMERDVGIYSFQIYMHYPKTGFVDLKES